MVSSYTKIGSLESIKKALKILGLFIHKKTGITLGLFSLFDCFFIDLLYWVLVGILLKHHLR